MKKNDKSSSGLACCAMGITMLIILTAVSYPTFIDVGFDLEYILTIAAVGLIGLFMIVVGVYYLVNATNLSKYAKECYGRVENIEEGISFENRSPDYTFTFLVINPDTSELETYKRLITHDIKKYSIGSYILCRQYKNDIDEINIIQENEVPFHVRERLERMPIEPTKKIELSNDREYITIDNIKYKRI